MSRLVQVEPEYIYVTIPAEYICVYHRILRMLADCGEQMLLDCKALCKDRNSGVIECYNMFNAAVAARKLGKDKLAETLIKYIKAKLDQMAKSCNGGQVTWSKCSQPAEYDENLPSFVFPIDETGYLKAFVSCGERPRFEINPEDMALYEHKFDNGFDEHFKLGPEDESPEGTDPIPEEPIETGLVVVFTPRYEEVEGESRPCADLIVRYDGVVLDPEEYIYQYYFDDVQVMNLNDVTDLEIGEHNFKCVVTYHGETKIANINYPYHGTIFNNNVD